MARSRTLAYSTIMNHLGAALKAGYPVDFNRRGFSFSHLHFVARHVVIIRDAGAKSGQGQPTATKGH